MGNAAGGGLEQEPAENSVSTTSGMSDHAPALQKKQPAPPKLPMPPEEELEERFNVVLVSAWTGTPFLHLKSDIMLFNLLIQSSLYSLG